MFLWRQEDTSSLHLFSVDSSGRQSSGRQMIRNFPLRQRLHLLLELLYGGCNERMRQEIYCSKFNISYSTKNMPLPSRSDYLQRLIEKTEQFLRRIRWKAHFFLNPDTTSSSKETYGFKSMKNPPMKRFRGRHAEDDPVRKIHASKQPLPQ